MALTSFTISYIPGTTRWHYDYGSSLAWTSSGMGFEDGGVCWGFTSNPTTANNTNQLSEWEYSDPEDREISYGWGAKIYPLVTYNQFPYPLMHPTVSNCGMCSDSPEDCNSGWCPPPRGEIFNANPPSDNLTPYAAGLTIYVRGYLIDQWGVTHYTTNQISFVTRGMGPVVTGISVTNIEKHSAVFNGNIISSEVPVNKKGLYSPQAGLHYDSIEGIGLYSKTVTGLSGATTYQFYAYAVNYIRGIYEWCCSKDYIEFTTLPDYPANFHVDSYGMNYIMVAWTNTEVQRDSNIIQQWNGLSWVNVATLATTATTYIWTGLSPSTSYTLRISYYNSGDYYSSSQLTQSTLSMKCPIILNATNITFTTFDFNWLDNNPDDPLMEYGIYLYSFDNASWNKVGTVDENIQTYQFTGLTPFTLYLIRVAAEYDDRLFVYSLPLEVYTAVVANPFCQSAGYSTTDSTCGNADGKIIITNPDYFYFYDFTLTDLTGGTYSFNSTTGEATGLTSNFYFLTASVKTEYQFYYGRDNCQFNWIQINDSDNPLSLISKTVKPQQCQPFDKDTGRIIYNISGTSTGETYNFQVYDDKMDIYYSDPSVTGGTFIVDNVGDACLYVKITSSSGCKFLIGITCVPSIPQFSLAGIKKIWVTPWTDQLDWNFWSTGDEDYYLEFVDVSRFISTKIKEYSYLTGGTIQWYSIPVAPGVAKLGQILGKVRQGFVFTDTLTVAIAEATATKWHSVKTILNPDNKWVYIILDANDNYWTGGYEFGATITTYVNKTGARGEDNGHSFELKAISGNKLLTSIDKSYVINHVV